MWGGERGGRRAEGGEQEARARVERKARCEAEAETVAGGEAEQEQDEKKKQVLWRAQNLKRCRTRNRAVVRFGSVFSATRKFLFHAVISHESTRTLSLH